MRNAGRPGARDERRWARLEGRRCRRGSRVVVLLLAASDPVGGHRSHRGGARGGNAQRQYGYYRCEDDPTRASRAARGQSSSNVRQSAPQSNS
jgi:hypothetical protein